MNNYSKPYINLADLNIALLKRTPNAHKGTHGSVAIMGGQSGMLGALFLASRTSLLSGAGRVYAFSISGHPPAVDTACPEIMHRDLPELPELASAMDAFVVGPGMGQQTSAMSWLTFCLGQAKPIIVDADALNMISQDTHLAALAVKRTADTIFTPHPGEAARLMNQTVEAVQSNRIGAALAIAKQFNCVCVLKGAESVCANQDGQHWINPTGNAGLASAGTGDVLSGLIGGLVAQGMPSLDALKLSVYIHGLAADRLVEKGVGPIGLTASEVAIEIRQILNDASLLI